MTMILGEERARLIENLGAGEAFVRLTRGEAVHPALTARCRKLAFALEPEDFAPLDVRVIPLWEGENSITGFFLERDRPVFIRYDVEAIEEYQVVAHDVLGLLKHMVEEFVEQEDVASVAGCFGYTSEQLLR